MKDCQYGSLLAEAWRKVRTSSATKIGFKYKVSLSAYEGGCCAGKYKASTYKYNRVKSVG